jgi:uncharacterized membrane protein YqaE (UPF0057 family)
MIYFLCIICPPLALLIRGKLGSVLLNLILYILGWIPGVIHAVLVISAQDKDRQNKKVIEAIKNQNKV